MIPALLIGRKGSVGFPRKNIASLLGRNLSEYPMLAALNSKYVDKVYLSTDDQELMELALEKGIEIIERPAYLCTKEALGEDVFAHGYNVIKERNPGREIEFVVLLFCNAPTFLAEYIDEGIESLRKNPELDSAITVSQYNWYSPVRARRIGKDGLMHPFIPFELYQDKMSITCDRDAQGDCYFADVCVSVVRPRCLEDIEYGVLPQKWMGHKIYPIRNWGGLDIDKEWQMPMAEFWLRYHGFTENKTPYDKKPGISFKKHLEKIWRPLPAKDIPSSRLGKIRLDKNESIDIDLARFLYDKISEVIVPDYLTLYPEVDMLYIKLAKHLGLGTENLFLSHGSDGVIRSVFEVFIRAGDRVIMPNPTFAMYSIYSDVYESQCVKIDYNKGPILPLDIVHEEIRKGGALLALPNPDSPTGSIVREDDLKYLISTAANHGIAVLIDEAYYPYYPKTAISWLNEFENLIITRTFSKAWALAGYRIGFAATSPAIAKLLHAQKPMYEIGTISSISVCIALEYEKDVLESVRRTMEAKEYFCESMGKMGFKLVEGFANFVNVDFDKKRQNILERLKEEKVLFKESFNHPSLEGFSRFSIGPKEVMEDIVKIIESA